MKNVFLKMFTAQIIFLIFILAFGETAQAATRSRRSSRSSEIRRLERLDAEEDLRIPILFGVAVVNLYDSWGDPRSGGRKHEGVDIITPRGEFIVSPTHAVVISIDNGGNGGKNVSTINPGGERYYYAHLDDFAEDLDEGQVLKPGDLIGYVGNTGNAEGGVTHLHFGIYDDDHDAENPFPRLSREFSTEERINAFEKILEEEDDSEELIRKIVSQYKNVFIDAYAKGIELPASITQILVSKRTEALGINRVLRQGMTGDDVKWLQGALGITQDGNYGPGTRAAVATFQRSIGQTADGVFGVATRVAFANSSLAATTLPSGCTATTLYSPTTGIKCTPIII